MTKRKGGIEIERDQLMRDVRALEDRLAELAERVRPLRGEALFAPEDKRAKVEELLKPLIHEMVQVQRDLFLKMRSLETVENAQRLDKLPKDLWEKIFIELIETDVRDLASLAMSCRYFRQKQELVETRLVEERMRLAEERRRKEEERMRLAEARRAQRLPRRRTLQRILNRAGIFLNRADDAGRHVQEEDDVWGVSGQIVGDLMPELMDTFPHESRTSAGRLPP